MNFRFIPSLLIISLLLAIYIFFNQKPIQLSFSVSSPLPSLTTPTFFPPSPTIITPHNVLLDVHYTPQAPFGNWKDPRQQDACEEASVLMAVRWVKDQSLTYQEALNDILLLSQFQEDKYGDYRDTSVQDTYSRLLKDYYQITTAEVINNISLDQILQELMLGNIVIAPTNGRLLKNPYFTQPGPERHMVLIRGYDSSKKEFITNDPGVTNGKLYRYPQDILYTAIRDYLTGYHIPIPDVKKNVIVVRKS